jgi:hypothetical protein
MIRIAFVLAAFSWLLASDVTGTWAATAETRFPSGKVETHSLTFVFTQTGTVLAGSVGPDLGHQFPIENGKAVNDSLTFDCKWGNGALLHFLLVAHADAIEGQAEGDAKQVPVNPGPNFTNTIFLTLRRVAKP